MPSPFQLPLFAPPEGTREPLSERQAQKSQSTAEPSAPRSPRSTEDPGLEDRLRQLLSGHLRSLTLTDNRTRIVSARLAAGGGLDVRIHRCFADAPQATLEAVVTFLQKRRGRARKEALRAIREHFARHRPERGTETGRQRPRRLILRPVGRFFDLRKLRDDLNHRYFEGALEVDVTWGRTVRPRGRRSRRGSKLRRCGFSVQLGSYEETRNVVRIHRCLDRVDVPRFVVESVVYHEMLHAATPPVVENGRRRLHTPEFHRRERQYRHSQEAERWIDANLEWLAGD